MSAVSRDVDVSQQRIEPQLKELMALHRPASLLPSWARSIRAQQSGGYMSVLKGRGMEYDESRPYQAGDDIRHLDWRVTARSGKPHTKLFREERERPVYICTDFSTSMFFATQGSFKSVQAARAAAILAWKAQQSGDRVGGLVFSATGHDELPPERGKPAAIRLLKKLVAAGRVSFDHAIDDKSSPLLGNALERLTRIAKPGSLLFIISDFRHLDESCSSDLTYLARHNDLTLLFVYDAFEASLPAADGVACVTNGNAERTIAFGEHVDQSPYTQQFETRYKQVEALCRTHRALLGRLSTTDEPLGVLQRALGLY